MYGISLRATHPTVRNLVLETISGVSRSAFRRLRSSGQKRTNITLSEKFKGQYVLVVDGFASHWVIMVFIAWLPVSRLWITSAKRRNGAAAVIAIGSCSAWGGVAACWVNPTTARSACKKFRRAKPLLTFQAACQTRTTSSRPLAHIITYGKPPKLDRSKPSDTSPMVMSDSRTL